MEAFTENINAVGRMSEETVCPSWTVQYTLKKTEASTLRCKEKLHTDQYLLFGPQRKRGRRGNRSTLGVHLKLVATQTGPLSKPLKDPEQ